MCGLAGMLFETGPIDAATRKRRRRVLGRLLVEAQTRGKHATGLATITDEGGWRIAKRPHPAIRFVRDPAVRDVLQSMDGTVTMAIGHARFATRGTTRNALNNHPIRAGSIIGTHNGTILNADDLFEAYGLERTRKVDSEILFRMADTASSEDGIDTAFWLDLVSECWGDMTAVMADLHVPNRLYIAKGDRPLHLLYSARLRAAVWASEKRHLTRAGRAAAGAWDEIEVPAMTLAVLETGPREITCKSLEPFEFGRIGSTWRTGGLYGDHTV